MKWLGWFAAGVLVGMVIMISVCDANQKESAMIQEIVRDTIIDTLTYRMPIPTDSVVLRYVDIALPVAQSQPAQPANNEHIDTLIDSVSVSIPIGQKIYCDSTYTAYISGFLPTLKLDSLLIHQPTSINTIIPINTPKQNHWGLGVQLGMGVMGRQIQPYIGVGITYNFFSW